MKYRNASDIFPDELLKEIQKYASGETIYVPSLETDKKQWGTKTGAKVFYEQRNKEIRYRYFHMKHTVSRLAEEYKLSEETIRKIIYK